MCNKLMAQWGFYTGSCWFLQCYSVFSLVFLLIAKNIGNRYIVKYLRGNTG